MLLTKEILEQGKSSNGGWSAKQLKLFGVEYPFPQGWKSSILGRDYPSEVIGKFVNLKNSHLKNGLNAFQQNLEQEKRRAENWQKEMEARKTRSYEAPSAELLAECPFDISQRQIDKMVAYGKTDRSYSILTDPDYLDSDLWRDNIIRMDLVKL